MLASFFLLLNILFFSSCDPWFVTCYHNLISMKSTVLYKLSLNRFFVTILVTFLLSLLLFCDSFFILLFVVFQSCTSILRLLQFFFFFFFFFGGGGGGRENMHNEVVPLSSNVIPLLVAAQCYRMRKFRKSLTAMQKLTTSLCIPP